MSGGPVGQRREDRLLRDFESQRKAAAAAAAAAAAGVREELCAKHSAALAHSAVMASLPVLPVLDGVGFRFFGASLRSGRYGCVWGGEVAAACWSRVVTTAIGYRRPVSSCAEGRGQEGAFGQACPGRREAACEG